MAVTISIEVTYKRHMLIDQPIAVIVRVITDLRCTKINRGVGVVAIIDPG
jgi:hypothetical protein